MTQIPQSAVPPEAVDRFFELLDRMAENPDMKAKDYADDLADIYEMIPAMKGTDFPKRIRDAKYDSDRMEQIVSEAIAYANAL